VEDFLIYIVIFGTLIGAMTYAALLVWFERRMLAWWQDRYGPNRVGPFGIGLALADILKLLAKEDWVPSFADRKVFVIAPCFVMIAMLMGFSVVPWGPDLFIADLNVGLLFFMAMSSMAVYAVLLGGLSSNNKYSLIGGLRSAAQMVSSEVFMGLSLMGIVMLSGSFSVATIVESQKDGWYVISQFFGFIVFVIAGIAESHRLPFDLPEAEQELVAGFHTEYSGMKFGIFMVGEYLGVILVSTMIATLFFGGWIGPDFLPPIFWLMAKTFVFVMFFILLRASIPRPRYDQLMSLGWKVMLPITLVNLVVTGGVVLWMNS
jgi:NADH-quinone oxidoreductase subunit H